MDDVFGTLVVIGLILGPAGILGLLLILLAIIMAFCKVDHEFIYPVLDLAERCNYKAAQSEFYNDIEYNDDGYYDIDDYDDYDDDDIDDDWEE